MARPDVKPPGSGVVFLHNLHPWHEPLDVDLVVGVLGKEELPGQFHLGCLAAEIAQVWSLTQLYYVDFSPSGNSVISTNTQSRFASAIFDGVLVPLRLAHYT